MKKSKSMLMRHISAASAVAGFVAGFVAACALPANAQTVNFTQRAGFYSGSPVVGAVLPATITPVGGGGFGGLEFWTDAPDTPLPGQTWKALNWGCQPITSTGCANGGVDVPPWLTNLLGFDPNAAGRSSLEVIGCPDATLCPVGTIDTASWTPVTRIFHHNHVIGGSSNPLHTVDVSSQLKLGNPSPFFPVDGAAGSRTGVVFTETSNLQSPCQAPPGGPANPLGGAGNPCDDFAFVSGLDLTSLFIPVGVVGNSTALQVNFRLTPTSPGALVCGSLAPVDPRCAPYNGSDLLIYTAEAGDNSFQIEAQLSPNITVALFVIGDCHWDQWKPHTNSPPGETNLRAVGEEINFWGSQWWKNNCMSFFTSNGYPAFKGYSTNAVFDADGTPNCGQWQARPGNSGNPPDTIPDVVNIIVTDNVIKQGPNIGGNIKQIVQVNRTLSKKDNYAGNPGHQGWGRITQILCEAKPTPPA